MRVPNKRVEKVRKRLDALYEHLGPIRDETIASLGEKDALHIIDFHANNWIDIMGWMGSKYKKEGRSSVTSLYFLGLFKELFWMQYLFLLANYPLIYRNLRHAWEEFSRAYIVDKEHPTWSLDERMEGMLGLDEKRIFGWRLIEYVLKDVLAKPEREVQREFYPLWDYLNRHVHPSVVTLDEVTSIDSASFVTDSFNERLARECLCRVDQVMDLVFAMIFRTFPQITEPALNYRFLNEWKKWIPHTYEIVQARS